jgi:hypothetical protein
MDETIAKLLDKDPETRPDALNLLNNQQIFLEAVNIQ